jgi:hypothetical protein
VVFLPWRQEPPAPSEVKTLTGLNAGYSKKCNYCELPEASRWCKFANKQTLQGNMCFARSKEIILLLQSKARVTDSHLQNDFTELQFFD